MTVKSYEAEQEYLQYKAKKKKINLVLGLVSIALILASFGYLIISAKTDILGEFNTGFYTGVTVLSNIFMIAWLVHFCDNSKERKLFNEAYAAEEKTRTGVFADIWNEYELRDFEGLFDEQTVVYDIFDYDDNIIQLSINRNDCDIDINVAEDSIFMLTNGGCGEHAELTVDMKDVADLDGFFAIVRQFVCENS